VLDVEDEVTIGGLDRPRGGALLAIVLTGLALRILSLPDESWAR
jgi:hypothetical protein